MPETDVLHLALGLMAEYGDEAAIEAARRADDAEAKGDREAMKTWVGVMLAVHGLWAQERLDDPKGERS